MDTAKISLLVRTTVLAIARGNSAVGCATTRKPHPGIRRHCFFNSPYKSFACS